MTEPRPPRPLAFVDLETTCLDRRHRRAWDVAVIRRELDGTETEWSAFVWDVDLERAKREALDIGRFYERHPAYARQNYTFETQPSFGEGFVAQELAQLLEGCTWVGIVPSFDEDTVFRMLDRHGLIADDQDDPPWHHAMLDVSTFAAGRIGVPPPHDHKGISVALGVDPAAYAEHTALGDARWARDYFDAAVAAGLDWQAAAWAAERAGRTP